LDVCFWFLLSCQYWLSLLGVMSFASSLAFWELHCSCNFFHSYLFVCLFFFFWVCLLFF
jgi:hypothetical protein